MTETIYAQGFKRGLKPMPYTTLSDWSDQNVILSKKSSAEPGQYRTSRMPYLKEPMDCLSPRSPVRRVVCKKGTQQGWTTLGVNWLFYIAVNDPGPCMMVLPTVELARQHTRFKVTPALAEMGCMEGLVKDSRQKGAANTLLIKEFPGGSWIFNGANSAAGFRHVSIKYLFLDDIDGYPADVEGEGDPVTLAKNRMDAFSEVGKVFEVSTPTDEEVSRIEKSFKETDMSEYYVPCPHCKKEQILVFGGEDTDFGIKWNKNGDQHLPETAKYLCNHCHKFIEEHQKTWMLANGVWIPKHPEKKLERGFHLASFYSPLGLLSWAKIVDQFLKAKDYPEQLKAWTNTRKAEVFKSKGDRPEWVDIKSRAEPYQILSVPSGGLFLTAGIDVQEDRFAVEVRAWGRGEENWLVWWGELWGNIEQSDVATQLDEMLYRDYHHASGHVLKISCAAIDTGYQTHAIYNYARKRSPLVIAVKGSSTAGRPIIGRPKAVDVNYAGETIKNGVLLWPVGTDTAKDQIYSRLKKKDPGPGSFHFPIGLGDDYYQELTSEKHVTHYVHGFPTKAWFLPSGKRNEALDCAVYSLAAAIRVGLNRIDWDKLEEALRGPGQEIRQKPPDKPKSRVYSKYMQRG